MRKNLLKLILSCAAACLCVGNLAAANIIPAPQSCSDNAQSDFRFGKKNVVVFTGDDAARKHIEQTVSVLEQKSGAKIDIVSSGTRKAKVRKGVRHIVITMASPEQYAGSEKSKQGYYELSVSADGVSGMATSDEGLYYLTSALLAQVAEADGGAVIKGMDVKDAPRYSWRGLHFDVSRHFHGIDEVKNVLDVMAHLKMNRFHLHLTDEDGWRIEIKKYPKLTEIGAVGNWSDKLATPARFFTQEQIREIVAYAAERQIMVIPEINMPGHAAAATRAYPEISGGGEGRWKGFTINPAKEETYQFLSDVLDEIIELFPAPYIHIGGDEVHFGNQSWFTDPEIQKFIKDNDLKDVKGFEHYFVRRFCKMVNDKGRKAAGWDEMLESGITPEQSIIMWWRHDKPQVLAKALEMGFEVVMCPRIPCYLDFVQDDSQKIGRRWGGRYNTLDVVYGFPEKDKVVGELAVKYDAQVLGLQGCLWTERVADTKRLYYMLFPRLAAIAENGWSTPEVKSYDDFMHRLPDFLRYLDGKGINYYNPFDPESTPEPWGPDKQDVIAEG